MRVEGRREESNDEFPVGMRVLAVDDDPICLKLLETLLRKCQYHVTTTSQAIRALEMLRENKNKFDLVISDVHMPDMDGFKLLELVGLEMDLPVIMLSAHGDTKLVMKGITHGACDYLLKPVRMEELKNIWQHVVRRKRSDPGDHSSNSHGKNSGERNGTGCVNSNADAKLCKKRKDQNSDDEDDDSDNENENDDPSTQKRPRVVWSVELHQKFVAAVNQLGLDKAVPKQILNLMNVEKLTRENVASHLQKYRLYLKRISSVANQQANMVAALGGPNSPYLRMTAMNLHGFNGSPQFPTNTLRSVPPSGVPSRLNTPTGLGLHGLASSSMAQLGHGQIPRQPNLLPGDQSRSLLQGRPTSLELNRLQPKNDNSQIFPISSNADLSGSSNSLQTHDTFGMNSDLPPNLLDHNRCNGDWPNAMQNSTSHDAPMNISGQTLLQDSRMDGPCLVGFGLMGDNMVQNMSYGPKQVWDGNRMDLLNHPDFLDGSVNTSMGSNQDVFPCTPILNRNTSFGVVAQPRVDSIGENNQLFEKSKHGGFVEQGRSLGDYGCNGAGSLEDVVTAMFKKEQDHVEDWRYPL